METSLARAKELQQYAEDAQSKLLRFLATCHRLGSEHVTTDEQLCITRRQQIRALIPFHALTKPSTHMFCSGFVHSVVQQPQQVCYARVEVGV